MIILRIKRGNPRVIPHEQENRSSPSSYPSVPSPSFLLSLRLPLRLSVHQSVSTAQRAVRNEEFSSQPGGVARLDTVYDAHSSLHGFKTRPGFRQDVHHPNWNLQMPSSSKSLKTHIAPAQWEYGREGNITMASCCCCC